MITVQCAKCGERYFLGQEHVCSGKAGERVAKSRPPSEAPKPVEAAEVPAVIPMTGDVEIRKRGAVTGEPVKVRFQPDELEWLDSVRGLASRPEMIRRMLLGVRRATEGASQ